MSARMCDAMRDMSVLLTKREVAALLRVSPRQVDYMIARCELRPIRLGARCVRIERADVERLIARRRAGEVHADSA